MRQNMNRKQTITSGTLGRVMALIIATALFPYLSSHAQNSVKIEAKSASSLDDAEGSDSSGSTVTVPAPATNSSFDGKSSISRVNAPVPSTSQGKVTKRETPVVRAQPGQPVGATQRVAPNQEVIDPKKMKRMAELRRELNISDAATKAKLAMPADDLFLPEASTTINKLSEPVLTKVAEYLALSEKKSVTVKGFYVEGESTKELAWARSLSLIEWMTSHSNLGIENFKASGPLPETMGTPKANSTEAGDLEFINRIELHLE